MSNVRIPMAICAAVGDILAASGSHPSLEALFKAAGVPGPPPELAHHSKWKMWLYQAGNDPEVDSLAALGRVIEEFMDLRPEPDDPDAESWDGRRERLNSVLEEYGFRYYRGGRILPSGQAPLPTINPTQVSVQPTDTGKPGSIDELLKVLVKGLPRAMHPLACRRANVESLSFDTEYDIQDLLHALLRPWVVDIRPEEYTPSYAGSSTRMDFLLPKYKIVIETKLIRDRKHGKSVGEELILDVAHYRRHPNTETLWCVIYDPKHLIPNPGGLVSDLEGPETSTDGTVSVRVFILTG